jgi:3-methylcrotonyl-CoA carboxylase alpha subunit
MTGFILIDGVAHAAGLAGNATLGYRLADGRAIRLEGGQLWVGDREWPVVVARDGDTLWVHVDGAAHRLEWRDAVGHLAEAAGAGGGDVMRAPMPGSVIAVNAAVGDVVAAGDVVLVIESMKLETAIRAPRAGMVATLPYAVGAVFDRDALLATLEGEPG